MKALLLLPLLLVGCFDSPVLTYADFLERIPPCPEGGLPSFTLHDLFNVEVESATAAFHARGYESVQIHEGASGVAPDVQGFCTFSTQGGGP